MSLTHKTGTGCLGEGNIGSTERSLVAALINPHEAGEVRSLSVQAESCLVQPWHWEEAPHPRLAGTPTLLLGKVFMLGRLPAECGVGIEQHTSLNGRTVFPTSVLPACIDSPRVSQGFENYRIFLVRFVVSVAVNSHKIKEESLSLLLVILERSDHRKITARPS